MKEPEHVREHGATNAAPPDPGQPPRETDWKDEEPTAFGCLHVILILVAVSAVGRIVRSCVREGREPARPVENQELDELERDLNETWERARAERLKSTFARCDTLVAQGKYDEAVTLLDEAIATEPHSMTARFRRAELLEDAERNDDAIEAYEELLAMEPTEEMRQQADDNRLRLLIKQAGPLLDKYLPKKGAEEDEGGD